MRAMLEIIKLQEYRQCTGKKRVKDSKWFKDKMLLAQSQEAGVVLDEEQQDFLADILEENNDCEDLQLQATSNIKADHVDVYDLDCDDEDTSNAIFMANLSPVGSLNNDTVAPQLGYIKNIISSNESYDELKGNSDVISYTDYMLTIGNDEDNYVPSPVQKNDMMFFVIEQMKSQIEKCNKVNQEAKSVNESLTNELKRYKDRVRVLGYAVKDGHSEQEAYLSHELYTLISQRSRGSNLYTISMVDMIKSSPTCLLSKASKTKSWLWHRHLSHLNFDTINKLGKSMKEYYPYKPEPSTNAKLQMLHMNLCGPMQVESINKKKYILLIVDDYSRFTWVKFLRSEDEAREIIIKFLKQAQVSLNAIVRYLRTENGTEFLNQTLQNYMKYVGITHNTSTTRTSQQNSVVERRNHMLVEAARTMLIFYKSLLFLWAEAVAIACYTQNRSLIIPVTIRLHMNCSEIANQNSSIFIYWNLHRLFNIQEAVPDLQQKDQTNNGNNKRTFNELTQMVSEQLGLGPDLHGLTSGHISSGFVLNQAASTSTKPPINNDWDLLFQPMFDEYFKFLSVVSTPIFTATLPPPDISGASSSYYSTSIDKDAHSSSTSPNIKATNSLLKYTNVIPNEEVAEFDSDTFTNPFAPPDTSSAKSSSRIVDTINMHTFQQPPIHTKRWTKDHPLVTIIGDPSKPVSTRHQLSTHALWCYLHAFLAKKDSKNYKEAMKDSCWIVTMQDEIHEFERLEVWELVPRPDNVGARS
nr:hypothetical protein [Tanacetum cinerariifolium]